jgi:hypothetical protein
MYSDKDMKEENMYMMNQSPIEDEMPVWGDMNQNMMPVQGIMNPTDTMPAQNAMPMYGNMPDDDEMMPMCGKMPCQEMMPMYGSMPMEDAMPMHSNAPMQNMMMPCCMMNQMPIMPYMAELEEDDEDEKCPEEVDEILRKLEKHHPEIFTVLSSYGIPYSVLRNVIRRIIHMTLKHK